MSVKALKPITPGQRGRVVNGYDTITTNKPEKSLLAPKKRTGGRNSQGKMTMKYIGGGHKKRYRIIDFKRNRYDDIAEVLSIEYDPNRSAFIALTKFDDNEKRYIVALKGLKVGDKVNKGDLILTGAYGFPVPINDKKIIEATSSAFGDAKVIFN